MELVVGKIYRKFAHGKYKFVRIEKIKAKGLVRLAHGELSPVGVRITKIDSNFTWVAPGWEPVYFR